MNDLPMSLRTEADERAYAEAKTSNTLIPLAEEPSILDYTHWRVIHNRFPYTVALKEHDLLIPKRVVGDRMELNNAEMQELWEILDDLKNQYDFVMENFPRRRSVLYHYHLHLGLYYDDRSKMSL